MGTQMEIFEGYKQLAEFFRKSERQTKRLLKDFLYLIPSWNGSKSRLLLTKEEAESIQKELRKKKSSQNGTPCP